MKLSVRVKRVVIKRKSRNNLRRSIVSTELLSKTRELNKILQQNKNLKVSFTELCDLLKKVLDANVYVLSKRGKVLGISIKDNNVNSLITEETTGHQFFPVEHNEKLLSINEPSTNVTKDALLEIFEGEVESYYKFAAIVPIVANGERQGTMVLARMEKAFSEDDLILCEYATTVVGLEILRAKSEVLEEEARKRAVVKMAIGTLSYSELEAVEHIFDELEGDEGLLVASKIADRVGITRSVIVNALRKFESAGVIESRSLGMKGTYIKILNDKLTEGLEELKK